MWGLMNRGAVGLICSLLIVGADLAHAQASQEATRTLEFTSPTSDSSQKATTSIGSEPQTFRNAWGIDILISNGGFGLGAFYRREFSDEWFGFVSLSVSESKDDREIEQFDLYTNTSYVPGKLNRFLVLPLAFGIQHRLFRDEITDNFRPYVNAGAGPTMIYVAPFNTFTVASSGRPVPQQVEFFNAIGKGQPHYTLGAFIGIGANFGTERASLFGVNFRYYFTYLFGKGLPSLYQIDDENDAIRTTSKKDFGGFFITVNVGMAY